MNTVVKESCQEQYGEDFVNVDKETAIRIVRLYGEYQNPDMVVEKIQNSTLPPYTFLTPEAYLKYKFGGGN